MKIDYKNVCSIRDAKVDFEPGKLIAVVGETNQGKSAMFYTFVDAFTNSPDFKKWINNEALKENPKATAKIAFTDTEGNWYEAEAGTGHVYFRANDVKYEKTQRKSMFELIDGQIPGLLYDPEDSRQIMNFQGEDAGLFPIDRSDTQIFKTYERLLSLSCTEDILRTIKLNTEEVDFKISDYTTTIQQNTVTVNKIEEFQSKVDLEKIQKLEQELIACKSACSRLNEVVRLTEKDSKYVERAKQIPEIPEVSLNVLDFQSKLTLLVKATNLMNVNAKLSIQWSREDFDCTKFKQLLETCSKAVNLTKDITDLFEQINKDTERLNEVSTIISDIKVCPYCGKPMEQ